MPASAYRYRRVVLKLGTSVLTGGTPCLDQSRMADLARQAAALREAGVDVIVVTSAAIAAGRERLGFPEIAPTLANKQMLAAVGQSRLMGAWDEHFAAHGLAVGQVLLTRADTQDRARYLNARDTLEALLASGIVPVVNENDAVATAEIKVGDNDTLSALVALLADADLLLLLTDQPGLFTADPRANPDAEIIAEVEHIDEALRAAAGGSGTALGTGGMATKLIAADLAQRAGIACVVASGSALDAALRLARGEALGTRFAPHSGALAHRKRWLVGGPRPVGTVAVDSGAARALTQRGGSLLAAGVTSADGDFARGDVLRVVHGGAEIARGLARYDADALRAILGLRSDAIEAALGYDYGPNVIHRDDLVVTG